MSRKLIEKARRRLENESGTRANPWGGRLAVALVYPNTYHQAMSNLGFLSVFHLLNNRPDTLCERFFLPDAEDLAEHRKTGYPLFSLDSGRSLTDFDVIAFSLSFENDYVNLPVIFDLARLPLFASERAERFPPLLAGGVCAFLNPEPLAEIMDLFAIGEAEAILPQLLPALAADAPRSELLRRLARLPGIYVPSLYQVDYRQDGTLAGSRPTSGAPAQVGRQWLDDLDTAETRSFVLTGETEFADMALTEVSRGCSRGCRFCAAGFLYLPPRERSLERLLPQIEDGFCSRQKQGLVGAAVSDYSHMGELTGAILERGGKVSVASLRIDSLAAEDVQALRQSGHKTDRPGPRGWQPAAARPHQQGAERRADPRRCPPAGGGGNSQSEALLSHRAARGASRGYRGAARPHRPLARDLAVDPEKARAVGFPHSVGQSIHSQAIYPLPVGGDGWGEKPDGQTAALAGRSCAAPQHLPEQRVGARRCSAGFPFPGGPPHRGDASPARRR